MFLECPMPWSRNANKRVRVFQDVQVGGVVTMCCRVSYVVPIFVRYYSGEKEDAEETKRFLKEQGYVNVILEKAYVRSGIKKRAQSNLETLSLSEKLNVDGEHLLSDCAPQVQEPPELFSLRQKHASQLPFDSDPSSQSSETPSPT